MDENKETLYEFVTVYKKDYVQKEPKPAKPFSGAQEFADPIAEGFKNYLHIDKPEVTPPFEDGDQYLEKIKDKRKKIGKMYFQNPLDHISIKGDKLLDGKSVYQVEYCNVGEEDIRRKLLEKSKEKSPLPEDWIIPLTQQKYDYRDPSILSKNALEPVTVVIPMTSLGQNENINKILNVKTGDSEYNEVIGKLGDFIKKEHMHGKIKHD